MPKASTRAGVRGASKASAFNSRKPKNPKDSHLYTDDNPATTIHGTGFKDKAAALRTLDLIKNRSLTYQFQTVNTMYNRAKHHPTMKNKIEGSAGNSGMEDAMGIFNTWLDETYPAERAELRAGGFKPLLTKICVEAYLQSIETSTEISNESKRFARMYVKLPKGKKLGNVLVSNLKPTEADWERLRYDNLDRLVEPAKQDSIGSWSDSELWSGAKMVSAKHLEFIAWAWSPLGEARLR